MTAPQIDIVVLEQILIVWGLIAGRTMSVLGWGQIMSRFFRRAFLDCAVAVFVVRVATWLESSEIFFVNSATNVMSACVAVTSFDSVRVWSCCISVKSAALACTACTFSAYPLVFEVLDDLQVSLNARSK